MNKHFLLPGKLVVTRSEAKITTVLGSCISVMIYDDVAKVYGMNHFLLPNDAGKPGLSGRYGEYAMSTLIAKMESHGAARLRMKAFVYGGAEVLETSTGLRKIGEKNSELAFQVLDQMGIKILKQDVGGKRGRKIVFDTSSLTVEDLKDSSDSKGKLDRTGFGTLSMKKAVKVLIVDDSATIRNLFHKLFTQNGLNVVGMARDAFEAREMIAKFKPDVLSLDIEMPKMNGVKFLEKIMSFHPMPVVMVSSLSSDGQAALKSLELGAIEFIQKPNQTRMADLQKLGHSVAEKVRAAANVNMSLWMKQLKEKPKAVSSSSLNIEAPEKVKDVSIICVGGNASAQRPLETLMTQLHDDTPPVVVAVSTIGTFVSDFIAKLKGKTKAALHVAQEGQSLSVGNIYIIEAGKNGQITKGALGPVLRFSDPSGGQSQIPSSDVLMDSAAKSYSASACGILLAGFGSDGVKGLESVSRAGGVTMAQEPSTCLMPHAPQNALDQGLVEYIHPPEAMAQQLWTIRNKK
ncbi:MAG: chemotaxis protein CheB [Bdellovibrionaceae bacterium]|nr:chemotaxis protein CheB [Pseudobdellovibrionaceae bacterium]|tara:strand:+ start:37694 stop:39247 length:1554 start_codon:yes stop_codon:yes gene_type:complete